MTKRAHLPAAFTKFVCDDAAWEWRVAMMSSKSEYVASLDGMIASADKALAAVAGIKDLRLLAIAEDHVVSKRQTYSMLRAVVPPDAPPRASPIAPARRSAKQMKAPRRAARK